MSFSDKIKKKIEDFRGTGIRETKPLSGGCISNAYKITLTDGFSYLLKINEHSPDDMFKTEAHGLLELQKAEAIKIPEVFLHDKDFILLEFISSAPKKKKFFEEFGRKFAKLHKYTAEEYGFYEDNYIGSTPQYNLNNESNKMNWISFYFYNRLLYQFKLAEKNGYADNALGDGFKNIENKIESILGGSEERPTLLHGDLWSGNYMVNESGDACLIDPAVYYGHREADLAMTKLFGGFSPPFYKAYNEAFPLREGWDYRENIYMLYHVMNHLNIFGRGYYAHALQIMKYYL
ncbi:MAG: fructosamine kinase family protein [Ignavibacteriaceae bacterium]|nr:fructosamine kinase family protein [Ignavibacteriaceae bacterium]